MNSAVHTFTGNVLWSYFRFCINWFHIDCMRWASKQEFINIRLKQKLLKVAERLLEVQEGWTGRVLKSDGSLQHL